ncbi:two-component regulator propeller domain-containing protein [Spirosoma sp. SC4-14]|uniref:sensor histidine kinase n=1 Tax=Spirosoma sp. SC4-14 TaxID=3128900 RepID=UPI0030CFF408
MLLLVRQMAAGQTPDLTFQKLSTKDGLPSNFVSAIATDTKGYLWIATRRGLCRYDGYVFRKMAKQQPGAAQGICPLPNGLLAVYWTTTGLFLIDSEGKAVATLDSVNFKDADPANDHFENLFADSKGNLWSSSYGLVRRYDLQHHKRFLYTIKNPNYNAEANHFFEDRQHRLWVFSEAGLYEFDRHRNRLACIIGPNAPAKMRQRRLSFSAMTEDNRGNLWLGSPQAGLVRFRPGTDSIHQYPTPGIIQTLSFANDSTATHNLWLGCNDGLHIFRLTAETLLTPSELTKQGVSISQIHTDSRRRIVWLATSDGLWQYQSGLTAIQTIHIPESLVHLPVVVKSILPDSVDTYWLGLSHTGVLHWSRKTNDFQLVPYPVPATTNNLSWVDNSLWAATDQGLFKLENNTFIPVRLPTRFSSNSIQKVLADHHQRLWVIHQTEGIQVFNRQSLQPIQLWNDQKARGLWTLNRYHDITESANGRIWIAAWYPRSFGMIWYNPKQRRLQELADFNLHRNFVGDFFTRVATGQQGRLLFAGGGGVNVTNAQGIIDTLRSVSPTKAHTMANDFCFGVGEDTEGRLWFGTGEGLHVYDARSRQMRRYTEIDGLLADDVSNAFTITPNDFLLLGQQNGFNLIDIRRLHQPAPLPPLLISGMQVNGEYRQLPATGTIGLTRNENDLRFTFTTLRYQSANATHFRYRLTGHPAWIDLNTDNELNLTNLKSGRYELVVQNGDAAGRWNPHPITLSFSIAPIWYETDWFRAVLVLSLLGTLYGFYRMRIGQERRKSELIRQRAEAETRALRAQMNPHFIFNCMNTIDAYILTNRPDAASFFLQKFSRLVRQVLENSRETLISVEQELETLILYVELEEERAEHQFSHRVTVDPDAKANLIPPLLLQPFVENAILHGLRHKTNGPGLLQIQIQKEADQLHCRIEDNGIGRAKAASFKPQNNFRHFQSLGSTVTTERINSLQAIYGTDATCTITDQNPSEQTGTVVDLRLPLLS